MNQVELGEQKALFQWAALQENAYPELKLMLHIPNEGKRSSRTGAELKRAGLKSGVPDILLPVARSGFIGLAIEMKSGQNTTTENQKSWLKNLSGEGWRCAVCWGFEAAATVISEYLGIKRSQFMQKPQKIEIWVSEGEQKA